MHDEPIMDVAHLGHLALLTPKPEESLRFFVDVMGMTESGRQGDSVYLRGWDDYERYSLQLPASRTSGLRHAAFLARSPHGLALPRPGRARLRDLLRDRVVRGAARTAPGPQEPGAAVSGARRQRPPAR